MGNNIKRISKERRRENTDNRTQESQCRRETKTASSVRGKGEPKGAAVHHSHAAQPVQTRATLPLGHLSNLRTECPGELVQTVTWVCLMACS